VIRHRCRTAVAGVALLLLVASVLVVPTSAGAQDLPPSSAEVPTQEIVPQPDSGAEPTEAGDRGGALQLGLLALVVVAVGGIVVHLTRQSRRARAGRADGTAPG
jgi:uncharacterized protein HemX